MTAALAHLEVEAEAARRRSIAVISHPDAGKSTLTEAIALHARAIDNAGAVHSRGGRSGVVSDWLEMEQQRGISVTSAALVFEVGDTVVNLLDTPGHADFSEDTYRVLTAVDAAIMLLDAARGLEPQTLKLFEVCRRRGVPVLTFVNKWDRPGRDALALCDELEQRIGLPAMPLTWPVGEAGRLVGLLEPASGEVRSYERAAAGAAKASERLLGVEERRDLHEDLREAEEAAALLPAMDRERFLRGEATPLLFGAALTNIGVRQLLEAVISLAPSPGQRTDTEGEPRPLDAPFSGFVFKMQSGMDRQHRDHLAFVRVCSGRFERGMVLQHERSGRPFATKYALSVFGRERSTVEVAYPGDVVGLVNAAALAVGDTVHDPAGPPVAFPPMPTFAPEHFAVASVRDPGRSKQFRRAIAQLQQEGVVQVLLSDRGDARPVLAAVGPLQLEVATFRLEREFGAPAVLDTLPLSVARLVEPDDRALVAAYLGSEVVTQADGTHLALFRDVWHLNSFQRGHPKVSLQPLMADSSTA